RRSQTPGLPKSQPSRWTSVLISSHRRAATPAGADPTVNGRATKSATFVVDCCGRRVMPEARVELARGCPRWILSRPRARHHRPPKCTTDNTPRHLVLSARSRCCQVLHLMVDGGDILKSIPNSQAG